MSHPCPWRWRLGVVVVGPKPKLWPRPKPGFWDLDTLGHKTKASKEVLNRVSVKDVVLDAVVALMQQLPVLGDEVSDGPGGKLLVELVLHVVDQHFNLGVNLHLRLHLQGSHDPFQNAVVTWYVNHLDQRFSVFCGVLSTFPCGWSLLLGLGHSSLACASLLDC